jgi:anaerobic nitric oxide reductase transcription regulator
MWMCVLWQPPIVCCATVCARGTSAPICIIACRCIRYIFRHCANVINDVLLLAGHFLELNRARLGLRGIRLSAAAEHALRAYAWPGNVRELEHVISRAALKMISRGVSRTEILLLEPELLDLETGVQSVSLGSEVMPLDTTTAVQPLRDVVDACQRAVIQQALVVTANNWAQAARILDVDSSNLHKLARRLKLK